MGNMYVETVAIVTRNNLINTNRLLSNINITLPWADILLINDSTDSSIISSLHKQVNTISNRVYYLDNQHLTKLVQKLNTKLPCIELLWSELSLGKKRLNTYAARNVAQICTAILGKSHVLYLDDDIIIKPNKNLFSDKASDAKNNKAVNVYTLNGCPDLSREDWIRLYLFSLSPKNGHNLLDLSDSYLSKISAKSVGIINEYLYDLRLDDDALEFDGLLPARSVGCGAGAYLSSNVCSPPYFGNFYNEDLAWFNSVAMKGVPVSIIQGKELYHFPARKRIVDYDGINIEEVGKIISRIVRLCECCGNYNLTRNVNSNILSRTKSIRKTIISSKNIAKSLPSDNFHRNNLIQIAKAYEMVLDNLQRKEIVAWLELQVSTHFKCREEYNNLVGGVDSFNDIRQYTYSFSAL